MAWVAGMTGKALSSPSRTRILWIPTLALSPMGKSSQALSCQVTPRLVHE